jgi:hypothetical protein
MKLTICNKLVIVNIKVTVLLALFTFHCSLFTSAQTFTQRVQQEKKGEGKVTITQDKSIEELVNGPKTVSAEQKATPKQTGKSDITATNHKEQEKKPEKLSPESAQGSIAIPDTTIDNRKKVMKGGYKINGYRVQVFAGGNSRNDRIKAERTGNEIKALYPGVPVYVHFYSPRWICRMGNYRTYEEADEVLRSVKKMGYDSAIIVKGKITVQYP